jgi:hypothetical protein
LPFALSDVAWHYHWLSANGSAVHRRSGLRARLSRAESREGSGQVGPPPPPPPPPRGQKKR